MVDHAPLNLALGKAAVQSSFSPYSEPDDPLRAISGTMTGAFSFHTDLETDPWWMLDLGQICSISKIVVHNRGDARQDRIRFFSVELFDPAIGGWTPVYRGENEFGSEADGHPLVLRFTHNPKTARFARLSILGDGMLHLDQVEMFGHPLQNRYEERIRSRLRPADPGRQRDGSAPAPASSVPQIGAIVGLVRGYADVTGYDALIARNAAIYEAINRGREQHYPLIIWHEGNITAEHQSHILAAERNRDVRFVDVSARFRLPDFAEPAELEEHWPVGYRLMCRFNCHDIWELTEDFEYILRVDEDCIIEGIVEDPFRWMCDADLDCGFSWLIDDDHQPTNATLPSFVDAYLSVTGIDLQSTLPLTSCFPYTNLMMARVGFFRSPRVWHFLTAVVAEPEFYIKRWGDHVVLGVPLHLHASASRSKPIQGLRYVHHSHHLAIAANDDHRRSRLTAAGHGDLAHLRSLPDPDRERALLKAFGAWPIRPGVRPLLADALRRSGHGPVADRLMQPSGVGPNRHPGPSDEIV